MLQAIDTSTHLYLVVNATSPHVCCHPVLFFVGLQVSPYSCLVPRFKRAMCLLFIDLSNTSFFFPLARRGTLVCNLKTAVHLFCLYITEYTTSQHCTLTTVLAHLQKVRRTGKHLDIVLTQQGQIKRRQPKHCEIKRCENEDFTV